MQVWTPHPSSRGFVNIRTDVSAQVVLTPSQPGERFYCDVETHPSSQSRRNKRGRMLYRVCSLNFHRPSRLQSHPVVTGCISRQHAICDMSFQSFDEECKAWGILLSDSRQVQSGLVFIQRCSCHFMGGGSAYENNCISTYCFFFFFFKGMIFFSKSPTGPINASTSHTFQQSALMFSRRAWKCELQPPSSSVSVVLEAFWCIALLSPCPEKKSLCHIATHHFTC